MSTTPQIVVCVAASDSFVGKAIRFVTGSNVNHALIAFYSDKHESWQALQTDSRGLVQVPVSSLRYSYTECYEFTDLNLLTALPHCEHLIGDEYDFLGILGFLLKILAWRLLGRRIFNPLHRKGELFCSEFVMQYLQKVCGMPMWLMFETPAGTAPGGTDLGVPSLQGLLQSHKKVQRVASPF